MKTYFQILACIVLCTTACDKDPKTGTVQSTVAADSTQGVAKKRDPSLYINYMHPYEKKEGC